ncbi:YceI family protein [Leptospira yasudae]|uniref:YceI family protein n=1 Tax=Leptospira yasudae TaxID=2202201 RepID=A0A6N4QH28_9LEPT|nr:YceI family protein [Leptospira yasudae]TGL82714.1 YceI family protein [Leptospira yasudae]TGL86130.1 YceI family protein [Leptospira yasudae]
MLDPQRSQSLIPVRLRSFLTFVFYSILILWCASAFAADKNPKEWIVKEANIRFLSEAPQETIQGTASKAEGTANLDTKKFWFRVNLNDLNVPNRLMNKHMHENYLETERFPLATFQGNIVKWDKASKTVLVEGEFSIHGIVKKNVHVQGTFEEKEKELAVNANFDLLLTDFKIEIPKLVILKLNEKIRIETSVTWQTKE